jgi:hypothetical protein
VTRDDLENMLRKLKSLGEGSDCPESKTALAIRERIMVAHGLEEAEEQKRTWQRVSIPRGTEPIGSAVLLWLDLPSRQLRGSHLAPVEVFATKAERKLFEDLCAYSRAQYRALQRNARRALRGWLLGHLDGLYPPKQRPQPKPCPKCGELGFGRTITYASRPMCESCGHLGPELDFEVNSYFLARASARRALPGPAAEAPRGLLAGRPRGCWNCRHIRALGQCWNLSSPHCRTYPRERPSVCAGHGFENERPHKEASA